jgi:hypothetical protein
MKLPLDQTLVDEFTRLLDTPPVKGQKEQEIQDFMEEHSELIPTSAMGLLHHGLQFNSVISKLPLATSEIPDWAVLSKRSDRFLCTIIELKQPKAKFFGAGGSSTVSRDFEAAFEQMRGNRRYIKAHEQQVREVLEPLLQPVNFKHLPIYFEHVLIYGRSAEKNQGKERIAVMHEREKETGFQVLTYDSVIDAYRRGERRRKNILRVTGKRYAFKKLEAPGAIFGFLKPAELELNSGQLNLLREEGYQIDAWRDEGTLLKGDIFFKTVAKSIKEEVEDIMDTLMTHYLKRKA